MGPPWVSPARGSTIGLGGVVTPPSLHVVESAYVLGVPAGGGHRTGTQGISAGHAPGRVKTNGVQDVGKAQPGR